MNTSGQLTFNFDILKETKPFCLDDFFSEPTEFGTIEIIQVLKGRRFILSTTINRVRLEDGTELKPKEWLQRLQEAYRE